MYIFFDLITCILPENSLKSEKSLDTSAKIQFKFFNKLRRSIKKSVRSIARKNECLPENPFKELKHIQLETRDESDNNRVLVVSQEELARLSSLYDALKNKDHENLMQLTESLMSSDFGFSSNACCEENEDNVEKMEVIFEDEENEILEGERNNNSSGDDSAKLSTEKEKTVKSTSEEKNIILGGAYDSEKTKEITTRIVFTRTDDSHFDLYINTFRNSKKKRCISLKSTIAAILAKKLVELGSLISKIKSAL